jgi:glutamate transport system substrate-binding protein
MKEMRIGRFAALTTAAVLAMGVAACGGNSGSGGSSSSSGGGTTLTGVAGKAQKDKKLVIGVKADQPGLGLQTGGKYEGFDIEIAKIVAADLGVPESGIEWKTTVSANREPFIQQGTVDLVIATYTINDERKQKVNFAGPYFIAGQDLLVKADNSAITGPDTLDGKKVCSVSGSTPAQRIKTDHPKAQLQLFDTYSKCVEALAAGSVDAVTTDDIILAGYAAQSQYSGKFKVVGKPFSTEPYGIGLKKDDKASCDKINDILKKAATDGRYKKAWDATLGKSGKAAPELDTGKLTNCA